VPEGQQHPFFFDNHPDNKEAILKLFGLLVISDMGVHVWMSARYEGYPEGGKGIELKSAEPKPTGMTSGKNFSEHVNKFYVFLERWELR